MESQAVHIVLLTYWLLVHYGLLGKCYSVSYENITSIDAIVSYLPPDTSVLGISYNNISQLNDNDLSSLSELKILNIVNNLLEYISPTAFEMHITGGILGFAKSPHRVSRLNGSIIVFADTRCVP